jgi:hypothetical protein
VERQGKLDAFAVRRIARRYGVNRGIRQADSEKDLPATRIAHEVNKLVRRWSDDLVARSNAVHDLAENLIEFTKGRQVSAISKLAWFCAPQRWTMYDSYVALAVSSSDYPVGPHDFYRFLKDRHFERSAESIQKVLNRNGMPYLFGERVIDKFLMLIGSDKQLSEERKAHYGALMEILPRQASETLDRTAQAVADTCAAALLTPVS